MLHFFNDSPLRCMKQNAGANVVTGLYVSIICRSLITRVAFFKPLDVASRVIFPVLRSMIRWRSSCLRILSCGGLERFQRCGIAVGSCPVVSFSFYLKGYFIGCRRGAEVSVFVHDFHRYEREIFSVGRTLPRSAVSSIR